MKSAMKLGFVLLCLAVVLGFTLATLAPSAEGNSGAKKSNSDQKETPWRQVSDDTIASKGTRQIRPAKYLVFGLNREALDKSLAQAPLEFTKEAQQKQFLMDVPMPDGTLARFRIEESPVLAPKIAAQFPTWKTFSGQGIDDPTAVARFDWSGSGFHGYVLSTEGTVYIDPYQENDRENYLVYYKNDYGPNRNTFHCKLDEYLSKAEKSYANSAPQIPAFSNGANLRTYRLAVAGTGEYTASFANQTAAFNDMMTGINRINTVYRRDLSVQFNLVSGTNLIYTNAATDPYANIDSAAELNANQANIDTVIGNANYDIGHEFGTGGGGVALSPVVCDGPNKAKGYSARVPPTGDSFWVDYAAHEMGHQFSGSHTYNTLEGGVCSTRSAPDAFEVASGATIMSYVGICTTRNLQQFAIDGFHVRSLTQIINDLNDAGSSGGCGAQAVTGNNLPTVNPGANFTIPKLTPFTLTAIGADADAGDVLTYSWEEFDLAPSASGPNGTPPNTFDVDTDGVLRPLFRGFPPVTSPSRTYPSLTYILNNANTPPATFTGTSPTGAVCETAVTCVTGENLPSQTRTMNFRVVVRDNRAAGGGIVDAGRTVTVDAGSGPFVVTSPNTAVTVPGQFTVTWNVAGTTAAPVNAANVKISLSTDSGNTFPTLLYASTPNDGSQVVGTQGVLTTTARIKIEGVGNIFFDVSDTDFTITAPSATPASVSGRITTPDGAPLAGVSLRLSGARTAKVIADADGDYRFESVDVDNFYTVTPTLVNYHFAPESQSFSLVGNKTDAVFTATRDAVSSGNAIDTADYFVRQHYLDFLGREPDESGFNFWSDQILSCGSDAGCRERRTINVSAAYFLSIEFQQTGGLVDGLYRASYGRAPRYAEFMPDTAVVARDVVVGRANWAQQLESNKRAFVDAWVERADFRAAYDGLTNKAFVDALIGHVGAGFNGDRDALLSGLNNGSLTRAAVLRQVVENEGFVRAKRNETFVMMEYFGYLRRDPDDSGYRFWLNKLNQFGGDFEQAEMVKAFITSGEYTQRFSQ